MALVTTAPASASAETDAPLSRQSRQKAHALGLTSATGLVIGSIIGTGVFTMPAVLAGAGTMGIIVLAVIGVGATLLAVLFGQLTWPATPVRRSPELWQQGELNGWEKMALTVGSLISVGVRPWALSERPCPQPRSRGITRVITPLGAARPANSPAR